MFDHVKFYMRIPLGNGLFTDGKIDYNDVPRQLGIDGLSLANRRVLDIAANDGFWTFWAERQGASDLLAIDVDSFDGYDWSYGGPPPEFRPSPGTASQWTESGAGFRALHAHFGSQAQRRNMSVYSLSRADVGEFDLIFNFGLLYHLRHPLLSLDRCRAVCKGAMILETHIVNGFGNLPINFFYNRDELGNVITNWCGPSPACVAQWLNSAGFPHVFSNRTNTQAPYGRRIFVACVNTEWADRFSGNENLIRFDPELLDKSRSETKTLLAGKSSYVKING